jgi:alpha-beta hydrolase superfamily lysophospholipase
LIDQNPSMLVVLSGSSLGGAIIFAFLLGLERGITALILMRPLRDHLPDFDRRRESRLQVIEAAYRAKVSKMLFLGSSCIYPRLAPQPIPEDALHTARRAPKRQAARGCVVSKK